MLAIDTDVTVTWSGFFLVCRTRADF